MTDPTVEILAVHDYGRQLADRDDVTPDEWQAYRRWRDKVLTTTEDHELASTPV